jgi:outer membrane protein W
MNQPLHLGNDLELNLRYYWLSKNKVRPYVSIGYNLSRFRDAEIEFQSMNLLTSNP